MFKVVDWNANDSVGNGTVLMECDSYDDALDYITSVLTTGLERELDIISEADQLEWEYFS